MIKYSDLIARINAVLRTEYPNIKRYGNDTVDKAAPPYFFVECIPTGINRQSKNWMHKQCIMKITYVQRRADNADALEKIERICDLLGMVLTVKDRKLRVIDYEHDCVGENNNIPQISFRLDWWENTETHSGEMIEHVHTGYAQKG